MDLLNKSFQEVLEDRAFRLKITEDDQQVNYQGRLAISDEVVIDFAIRLPRSDGREIAQIVFDHLLTCPDDEERGLCLDIINHINLTSGLCFYLVCREDGTIFARHMLPIDPDRTEVLLETIQLGSRLVKQARELLVATLY